MQYLHYDVQLGSRDAVQVVLDRQANVLLMDDANYSSYRCGRQYRYYGGVAKRSPVTLRAPCSGKWNVVVDLGGCGDSVRATVKRIRC